MFRQPIVFLEKYLQLFVEISIFLFENTSENYFFYKKKWEMEKNGHIDSSLSVTTFSGLKLMKLLGFYENLHVLATCLTPKHEK